jgi:hypothetical protein
MPADNSCVPSYVFVPDSKLDCLTDSHVKLDILIDTQEPFMNSHHKVALNYDEDTRNLVEEQTLSTLDNLSLKTPILLLGTHPQPLNVNAMRLRLMHLNSITTGQRLRFLNKKCP